MSSIPFPLLNSKPKNMIKMPIQLETTPEWKPLLAAAIAQRDALEIDAEKELEKTGEYIRPIMLIQAQPRNRNRETLTVEVVEKCLLEEHGITEEQIARATGEDKGLIMLTSTIPNVKFAMSSPCRRCEKVGIVRSLTSSVLLPK